MAPLGAGRRGRRLSQTRPLWPARVADLHSKRMNQPTRRATQRAFCIAALPDDENLEELHELLRTAGVEVMGEMVQRREQPHPNTYLGPGKAPEAKQAAHESDANVIVCDDELSARQERNLEQGLGRSGGGRPTVHSHN